MNRRRTRFGFTLLEVIVGTVLMATVVVSLLNAASLHQRRQEVAIERQAAIRRLDQLVSGWFDRGQRIPSVRLQPFSDNSKWMWQTQVIGAQNVFSVPTNIVRVSIFRRESSGRQSLTLLTSLDLLQDASR
jgi:type II secretory pathway component PulJ